MSNAPTTLMGLVPLFRAVVRSATDAQTTDVTADDSGTLFVNLSTLTHAYTLPAVAFGAGKCWVFFNGDGSSPISVASTAANLMGGNTTATTMLSSSTEVGDCLMIICDGTNYYGMELFGSWGNT